MLHIILVITLLMLVYLYITRNNNYWEENKVPYEKPSFFWGNFKDVMIGKIHFGLKYAELYSIFENTLYSGYFRLTSPGIIIRDPELIKTVVHTDFNSYSKNDLDIDGDMDPLLKINIAMQHGEEWKKNRSLWTHGLTSNKLKGMFEVITENSNIMIDYLKKYIKTNPDEPMDSSDLSSKFFIDIVVTSVFGLKINSFELKLIENPFKRISTLFFTPSTVGSLTTMLLFVAPWLTKLLRISSIPKYLQNELISLGKDILKVREKTGFSKNNSFDLILHPQNKDRKSLEIASGGLVMNFLIDGTETSAAVAGFMLYSIAADPNIQTKLRKELVEHANRNDGKITNDNLKELIYLDMLLSETLRLYPPVLALLKVCTKPTELPPAMPGGNPFKVDVGTSIIIPVYGLHMDPKYFPNPKVFDPERFNEENKELIEKYVFLPFGDGPRACIGRQMAQNQIKVEIATIIRNFEIRLAPQMENKPLVFDPAAFITRAVGNLWITIHNINE